MILETPNFQKQVPINPIDAISSAWIALRQAPVQAQLWTDLAASYTALGLSWQTRYCARQALRCYAGQQSRLRVSDLEAAHDELEGDDALLGRAVLPGRVERVTRYAQQVQTCAGDWLSWLYLARLQEMAALDPCHTEHGKPACPASQHALNQARQLEPIAGESLHWMGVWRLNAGDAAGAVGALGGLLDVRPVRTGSMMYLGEALCRQGNGVAAEKAFARAALSNNADFLQLLAGKVYAYNYWQEAISILQRALTLRPGHLPLLLALARMQSETYALADCRATLHAIAAIEPGNAAARMLLAGLQGRMGDAQGHLQTLEAEYQAGADPLSRVASSIAMTMLYNEQLTAEAIALRHRQLCAPIEAATPRQMNFSRSRDTQRKLRIGYVSGDFHRQHPVNIFMLPVLLRHDRRRFEICIYHSGTLHDEYTRQARACADRWTEAAAMDDAALQQAIVADGVDVLVDLAGHTSTHRLGVFAKRAAPVQATFLGYPHSTGLSTIDWMIGDATTSPAQHAHLFSEGIAQMPDCVWCWAPVDDYPLPPPRAKDAPVVFGSFNNAMKLTPATLALWAQVLHAVPGAQLLLKAPSLRDPLVQSRLVEQLAGLGIGQERLQLRGPTGLADMMQEYGDIDIALDPLPYNGGTTTLQALWMGVPMVCLVGGNFAGRMGASFMRTLGQPDWAAPTPAGYVAAAVKLAAEISALRAGRAALRAQMAASPLCDIATYVRDFEALLLRMWQHYCAGEPERVIGLGSIKEGMTDVTH